MSGRASGGWRSARRERRLPSCSPGSRWSPRSSRSSAPAPWSPRTTPRPARRCSQLPSVDAGADGHGRPQRLAGDRRSCPPGRISQLRDLLAASLPRPQDFRPASTGAARSCRRSRRRTRHLRRVRSATPQVELGYRTDRWLREAQSLVKGCACRPTPRISQRAWQAATATFGDRGDAGDRAPGSACGSGRSWISSRPATGDPEVSLKVTGIIRPTEPGDRRSGRSSPSSRGPRSSRSRTGTPNAAYWLGAGFIGPRRSSTALGIAYQGASEQVSWFVPTANGPDGGRGPEAGEPR